LSDPDDADVLRVAENGILVDNTSDAHRRVIHQYRFMLFSGSQVSTRVKMCTCMVEVGAIWRQAVRKNACDDSFV
jgi:hypothetical protein